MMAHDEAAKAKGLVVMNEIGVDPGVDHLYAMKAIDEVQVHERRSRERRHTDSLCHGHCVHAGT